VSSGGTRQSQEAIKAKSPTRVQYGALPYAVTMTALSRVLLVTSRENEAVIIPKAGP